MRLWLMACIAGLGVVLGGCELLCAPYCGGHRNAHSSSSLVEFLYPEGKEAPRDNSIPELHVPLRVGLAFLPAHGIAAGGPGATLQDELLERIKQHFSERKFVSEIVVVPAYYLGTQRGFTGLQAVQRLYSVDLMALVSYDQVTNADQNGWSLGYFTIVGAYVLKGDRYDVSTLLDLAVVDPGTRSLVLRAGGIDTRHGSSTWVAEAREAREAGAAGFRAAADQMIEHFDIALTAFEADVKAGRANVRVVHNAAGAGTGGNGDFTWPWLAVLSLFVARRYVRRAGPRAPAPRADPGAGRV